VDTPTSLPTPPRPPSPLPSNSEPPFTVLELLDWIREFVGEKVKVVEKRIGEVDELIHRRLNCEVIRLEKVISFGDKLHWETHWTDFDWSVLDD
jgi:hypothetical protein